MTGTIIAWSGRFLEMVVDGRWEFVRRPRGLDAAIILAINEGPTGEYVILVEEYRIPLGARCLGLPAGLVGDECPGEDPAVAAARELEEETGYRAANWRILGRYASSPGLTDECFTLFEARGLTMVGKGGGTADEDIVVHRVAMAHLAEFIAARRADGCVIDVKLLALGIARG